MKREFDHAFPQIFRTYEVTVDSFVKNLTESAEHPKVSGIYDVHPTFQRGDVHSDIWVCNVGAHYIAYGQLDPIKFHTVRTDDGFTYRENLDGKQRALAFQKIVRGGLRFVNYGHLDPTGTLDAIHGLTFEEWPVHIREWFLHERTLTIEISPREFSFDEKSQFFVDCQEQKRTSAGEHLNAFHDTKVNVALRKLMAHLPIGEIWPNHTNKKSRGESLAVMNSLAFQYFSGGKRSRAEVGLELGRQWNKEFTEFTDDDILAFGKLLNRTFKLLISLGVNNKNSKPVNHAFFFLFLMNVPADVITKIRERYSELGSFMWPNDTGKHDQGWRRYKYLVGEYIGCTE
jgi:hypothetical protein